MSKDVDYGWAVKVCEQLGWTSPNLSKWGTSNCRYGLTWTTAEQCHARDMFYEGHSIKNIAKVHGRDEGGIRSKLRSCGWYDDFHDGTTKKGADLVEPYEYSFLNFQPMVLHTEELNMQNPTQTPTPATSILDNSKPIVEQVTMVRGQDVRKLKPQHLISIIREIEAEINDLSSFTVQSKYIAARLTQLRDDLTKVVEVLDTM